MVGITNAERPLRLLALDGGGVTAISELIILQTLMLSIQRQNHISSAPKPCEYFDIIGGTGAGGLLAIMLGRLRLSIEEALHEYRNLAQCVFAKTKSRGDGMYKATNMERAIQSIVRRYGSPDGQGDSNMTLLEPQDEGTCKTFVCARNAAAMTNPRLFRSYPGYSSGDYPHATIWQAGRATTALPKYFKRIRLGPQYMEEEFIDLGCKNPVKLLLAEASRVFAPNRSIACIVSIGSGVQKGVALKKPGFFQRIIPTDLISAMGDMTNDADEAARDVEYRFSRSPDLYFRFNVEQGLENIQLGEWKKLRDIEGQAVKYVNEAGTGDMVLRAASALSNDYEGKCVVSGLGF